MDRSLINTLVEAIRKADARKTTPYDTQATVTRVENGTAWVHIPGGVDETPVRLTVDAKKGDTVQVRISGGRAHLTGNATAPPTDDTKANKVASNLTATQKAVKAVKDTAEKAARIATSTAQYFWVSTGGTDNGAHVTSIPQSEFEADPQNGGGNTLLTTNGVAVRDGLTELATFSADGITFGDEDGEHLRMKNVNNKFYMRGERAICVEALEEKETSSETSTTTVAELLSDTARGSIHLQSWFSAETIDNPVNNPATYSIASMTASAYNGSTDKIARLSVRAGDGVAKVEFNASALIVKQTYSATGISSDTFYHVHTFNISKSGYTPIAVNVRINQAAIYCSSIDYTNQSAATVSVAHRSNNTISNLNLYLEATYARSELL